MMRALGRTHSSFLRGLSLSVFICEGVPCAERACHVLASGKRNALESWGPGPDLSVATGQVDLSGLRFLACRAGSVEATSPEL